MLASELITDIRSELLEPVAGFWTATELLTWINRAEKDFSNRVRGFEGKAYLSTVAGRPDYPLPANWLSEAAVFVKETDGSGLSTWTRVEPTDLQRMSREVPNFLSATVTDRGATKRHYIWNNSLYVHPVPDTDGDNNILMFFKAKAVPLTAVTDSLNVDDTLADGIKAYVLERAWLKEKELELAATARNSYELYVRLGLRSVKLREMNKIHQLKDQSPVPFTFGG